MMSIKQPINLLRLESDNYALLGHYQFQQWHCRRMVLLDILEWSAGDTLTLTCSAFPKKSLRKMCLPFPIPRSCSSHWAPWVVFKPSFLSFWEIQIYFYISLVQVLWPFWLTWCPACCMLASGNNNLSDVEMVHFLKIK